MKKTAHNDGQLELIFGAASSTEEATSTEPTKPDIKPVLYPPPEDAWADLGNKRPGTGDEE